MADGDWLTATDIGTYLGRGADLDADPYALEAADGARRWCEDHVTGVQWSNVPPDVKLGATMLAGRWFMRRNSPNGIAGTYEAGAYLPRTDRDIEMLLGLRRPRVG